jgi:TorA maturation chaperone TorD
MGALMNDAETFELARSRSLAYGLLAKLLLRGLDREQLELVGALPGLAEALPDSLGEAELDELAAEHHTLFHLESTPYAAEFTGATEAVHDAFRMGGFVPRLDDVRADHLGVLLGHLSFLVGAEADALEDGNATAASRVEELISPFIDLHLLSWLPCYLASALDRPTTLWTSVLQMAYDVLTEHRADLSESGESVGPRSDTLDLDAPKTSLRDVAEFLSQPGRCGVYISRDDITAVARGAGAPRGFGSRRMMLENLLQSAAEYEQSNHAFRALRQLVASRGASMLELAGGRVAPALLRPWLERVDETSELLQRMENASCKSKPSTTTTPAL